MASFTARKHRDRDEDDTDPELAIAVIVYRHSASEEALLWVNNLVSAYRQLSLSPYVPENVSEAKQEGLMVEDATTRYYFEFVQARSLSEVLFDDGVLHETSPLFKLYARELLLAIIDILEQSTHHLSTRVLPDHVMTPHSGRRLFLGKLDFGDYIDPFQSNSHSTTVQNRENHLLQDLSVVLFSILYPVTLPQNMQDFRTRYVGHRDNKFENRYRINCKSKRNRQPENAICVSREDKFAVVLAGDNPFDEMWNYHISSTSMLVCIDRRYSPMEFLLHAKSNGECTITFSPLGNQTVRAFKVSVTIIQDNFRLHSSKTQTLISACAAVSEDMAEFNQVSLRMLLHQNEYFQPLSKSETNEAERELLERCEANNSPRSPLLRT